VKVLELKITMTTHPFDRLDVGDGAAVILTPCPGTQGVCLRESLSQLVQAGAKSVITLMPLEEMERSGVSEMPSLCAELGLAWFHLPIEDDAAPGEAFHAAWERDQKKVLAALDHHDIPAVHCRGGSGRTGLMTAIILLEHGVPYEQVVAEIQRIRPKAFQLDAHVNYLEKWQP
jgi:protein-tyrosine phosphatase